ncbi:NEDD4 family-interacting protein 1-like isoform X1 [Brienomyrus brachyistius]|uniref:NEDD4 family-interacting protein 1-like isoform X1 n=1 Tax=Brienomyrus brachyistius TaxID=42636 RepID=UPI0020B220B9|nr:NEDD4 family-interacting protein 1-like isoform X1 [Brienomyrus brachyistius]
MKRSQGRVPRGPLMPRPPTATSQHLMQLILSSKKMGPSPSLPPTTWPHHSHPTMRRREPKLERASRSSLPGCKTACASRTCQRLSPPVQDDDFAARDDFDDADQLRIGNDAIFMLTFFMAFLFNWVGFFLSFCLTTSAAGRYGAVSGFGLSLIKWILIVRFSTYFPGYFDGQYWLWWVFLVLGLLLFLRGFINYAKVRKMADSFSTLPRTRVLFIY